MAPILTNDIILDASKYFQKANSAEALIESRKGKNGNFRQFLPTLWIFFLEQHLLLQSVIRIINNI